MGGLHELRVAAAAAADTCEREHAMAMQQLRWQDMGHYFEAAVAVSAGYQQWQVGSRYSAEVSQHGTYSMKAGMHISNDEPAAIAAVAHVLVLGRACCRFHAAQP
jgi:hypothetical protein